MENNNVVALDELNKGCYMGIDALRIIMDKSDDEDFKKVIFNLSNEYSKLSIKVNELYDEYSDDEEIDKTSALSKLMTWYGIEIRTIKDSSTSKLSELTLQGLNMGIIDGEKLFNNKDLDKNIIKLIKKYINLQEEYVEKIKKFI